MIEMNEALPAVRASEYVNEQQKEGEGRQKGISRLRVGTACEGTTQLSSPHRLVAAIDSFLFANNMAVFAGRRYLIECGANCEIWRFRHHLHLPSQFESPPQVIASITNFTVGGYITRKEASITRNID